MNEKKNNISTAQRLASKMIALYTYIYVHDWTTYESVYTETSYTQFYSLVNP